MKSSTINLLELKNDSSTGSFFLSSIGLGLMLAWNYLYHSYFFQTCVLFKYNAALLFMIWNITTVISILVCIFLSPERVRKSVKRIIGVSSALIGSTSSGLLVYATTTEPSDITLILIICSLIFFGLSYGSIIWLWAYSSHPKKMIQQIFRIGLSCMISGLVYIVFNQVSFSALGAVIIALPILSVITQVLFQSGSLSKDNYELVTCFVFRQPQFLIISLLLLCLLFGVNQQFTAPDSTTDVWSNNRLLVGAVLCLFIPRITISKRATDLAVIIFIFLLVIGIAIALLTSVNNSYPSVGLFRVASCFLMSLCLAGSGYISAFLNMPINRGFLIGLLIWLVPLTVGQCVWLVWPLDYNALLVIASILLITSIATLFTGAILKNSGGGGQEASSQYDSTLRESLNNTEFELACISIAAQYALSKREREILIPLAKGYTLKTVSEQFIVSYNTIKVQVRSIYQKMGIHSKNELLALIDSQIVLSHKANSAQLGVDKILDKK